MIHQVRWKYINLGVFGDSCIEFGGDNRRALPVMIHTGFGEWEFRCHRLIVLYSTRAKELLCEKQRAEKWAALTLEERAKEIQTHLAVSRELVKYFG